MERQTHFVMSFGKITHVSHEQCPLLDMEVSVAQAQKIEGTEVVCCKTSLWECPHLTHAGVHGNLVINCDHPKMENNKFEGKPYVVWQPTKSEE